MTPEQQAIRDKNAIRVMNDSVKLTIEVLALREKLDTAVSLHTDLQVANEVLMRKLEKAKKALKEIQLGQGEFSRDLLEHADNTIVNLRRLANDALAELERE